MGGFKCHMFQSGPWYFGQEDSWSRSFILFFKNSISATYRSYRIVKWLSEIFKSDDSFRYITLMIFFLYNVWVVPLRATFNIYQVRMVFEII